MVTDQTNYETARKLRIIEKTKLRKISLQIIKIPKKFTTDGKLDLDKVHLALQDYQK